MPRRVDDLQRPSAEIEHITVSQRQILGLRKLLPGHQRIDFPLVARVAHRRPRFHKPFAHRIVQRETAAVFPIQRVEIHMREMARAAHMVRVSVCRNNNEGKPCKPFDVFRQRADTSARVDQCGPVFSDHEKHINEFVFTDQISIRSYFYNGPFQHVVILSFNHTRRSGSYQISTRLYLYPVPPCSAFRPFSPCACPDSRRSVASI